MHRHLVDDAPLSPGFFTAADAASAHGRAATVGGFTMKRLLACLPSVLLALAPLGAHAAAPIHLKAYRSLVNLASPQFSPDGARVIRGDPPRLRARPL